MTGLVSNVVFSSARFFAAGQHPQPDDDDGFEPSFLSLTSEFRLLDARLLSHIPLIRFPSLNILAQEEIEIPVDLPPRYLLLPANFSYSKVTPNCDFPLST